MKEKNDYELIYDIATHASSDSLIEFARRHEGIIIQQFSRVCSQSGISIDTLAQDKYIVINNAAKSFKEEYHTKPTTWLCSVARFHALNTLKEYKKHSVADGMELDEVTTIIDKMKCDESFKNFERVDTVERIRTLAEQYKDKRIKQIIDIRFFNSENRLKSYKQIGREMRPRMSTQGVKNLLDCFLDRVKIALQSEI